MAEGGMIPKGTPPWAEPEADCELFIRTTSEQQARNASILAEAARRLGVSDG